MADTGIQIPAVREAARIVGSVAKLAALLGIKGPAIYHWKIVPAKRVLPIEHATGGRVSRHQLRPDLYPIEGAA